MNTTAIKKIIIFLILIFSTNTLTASESVNSYEYLKVQISNDIKYGITKQNNAYIEELSLTSYFFPKNYDNSQALNELISTHNYIVKESNTSTYLFFDIKEFSESTNKISNSFTVQSTINKPKISQKISFPIEDKTSNHETYTSFSGLIDTNDAIYTQASALAQGEDDVFIIASKVAKWIQEDITYDLSTITQNPNQKSSEVFISKTGVCQEITHLFISMMRSLDIPARVVTGYAYTNSEEVIDLVGSNWGGHAWAEVLIGDTWVPFDLTYNQYGYVDASHIVLDKSKEIRKQSILVEGKGRNFQITPNSLSNENVFTVIEKEKQILDPGFSIELTGPQELSPQSYGHIKVKVKNTKDYYQNIFLNLAKVNE
ncbi:MAG: transglutaminase-like domain-containing protein, partial [Nanoarchaeota archaeon]|nr:transglutaminase-like domain-containing protein [Nanoarchaeota archaeon]